MRLSPFIRRMVYGVSNWHGTRYGGWRPDVFFATGLELGMWMSAASLAAWWLWRCGASKTWVNFGWSGATASLDGHYDPLPRQPGPSSCRSIGMAVLWLSTRFKTRLFLAVLLLAGPLYVGARVTNLWSGQQAVDVAINLVGPERGSVAGISLHVRKPARCQGPPAADLRLGRVWSSAVLFRRE